MCGITGWVSFERDLTDSPAVGAMLATLRERGPDDEGRWSDRHVALGHRRLAVVDLPGGRQPMTAPTPDGPVTITYSGEVYNYVELRGELRARGHRFRTSSDTEVVLRAYLQWGTGLAGRLNGIFAFAVWDARNERLALVRDRLGVKPLYYQRTEDGLLFGSEPKAILAHPCAERVVDIEGLHRMLAYTVTLPGVPWRGLREVEPGTVVTVSRAGLTARTYWTLGTRPHRDDLPATIAHTRHLLDDIVRRQLVADVPVCVLLSGGIDSGALTALAAAELAGRERVRTCTVDFAGYSQSFVPDDERADPDQPYVREVVDHVGCDHRDLVLDDVVLAEPSLRRRAVWSYDTPPGSGDRDRSLYLLFRAVREHSVVALSGESADELFGGYHWFHDPAVQRTGMFGWITSLFRTYGPLPEAIAPDLAPRVDVWDHVVQAYAAAVREVEPLDGETPGEHRMRVAGHHHLTRHLRVLLDRKDRLSMATGLEARVPYCDHRLVEYVYNVPWAWKAFDGRPKSLLRSAVRDMLPASVLHRAKSAFPAIQEPMYVAALQRQAKELVAERDHRVFEVVDRRWLGEAVETAPSRVPPRVRNNLEWVLNLSAWLELYRPQLKLS
ncbi:asparagine synthase (glutamine-hydrolyzing) [Couchioplanes azureus]|uniref:asparagine synthase (glutamine-hydrolyzing) n=1 Tax=Couchioplanes caeruleus TaxID=56438 RepID=UPI001670E4F1|nr:asparagine synthase (glutamine-hydrolyzing) [Couchioplanes caeruleus]GGQ74718.1 asparagine synthetase B [Couchioplanes caeruleus subsp. azureus]